MTDVIPPRTCPCCGATVTKLRTDRVTSEQAAMGYARCLVRGYTRERLLTEEHETLDLIAPGFTEWLRALPEAS